MLERMKDVCDDDANVKVVVALSLVGIVKKTDTGVVPNEDFPITEAPRWQGAPIVGITKLLEDATTPIFPNGDKAGVVDATVFPNGLG